MCSELIPALGTFSRLPIELRDIIYTYTFLPNTKNVNVHLPCNSTPTSPLSLVSRTFAQELTTLAQSRTWPCSHTLFVYKFDSDSDEEEDSTRLPIAHDLTNTRQMRIEDAYYQGAPCFMDVILAFPADEQHWRRVVWSAHPGVCQVPDHDDWELQELDRICQDICTEKHKKVEGKAAAIHDIINAFPQWNG